MSGGEPSSIKRCTVCAARVPVLSKKAKDRRGVTPERAVYGLLSQQRGAFSMDLCCRVEHCPSETISGRPKVALT